MRDDGQIIKGRLNGNKRVKAYNLKSKEVQISDTDKFVRLQSCYSRGIHWIKIHKEDGGHIHLGPELYSPPNAERDDIKIREGE